MTKICNNPRSKHVRRVSAQERTEKLVSEYRTLLSDATRQTFTFYGTEIVTREELTRKLGIHLRTLDVLKERTAKPGNSSTKKNRTNTLWRSA